tara:strand:- start:12695 stop:12940 length:246 start_codon:yes stop_codon:yes gene_type:complete
MMSDYEKTQLYSMVEAIRLIAESSVFVAQVIQHLKFKPQPTLYDLELLKKASEEMARLNKETTVLSERVAEQYGGESTEEE